MILNYMFHSTVADGLGLGFRGCGSPTWLNALDEIGSSLSLSYPVYKMELEWASLSTPQSRRSHCHQSGGAWPTLFSDEETVVRSREENFPGVTLWLSRNRGQYNERVSE